MFIGENVTLLRECFGYTQKELEKKLSLGNKQLQKIESNDVCPTFEIVRQLSDLFYVETAFFFEQFSLDLNNKIEHLAYRETKKGTRKKEKLELSFLNFLDKALDELETWIKPVGTLLPLIHSIEESYDLDELTVYKFEEIAETIRNYLNINKNSQLLGKLEKNGIFIVERNLQEKVDAYSIWSESNRPYIVLSKGKNSFFRRNFDLAHELSHLLLHRKVEFDVLENHELKKIENEANLLASSILLPENRIKEEIALVRNRTDPREYIHLKEKYGVSIQAFVYRAFQLGILTENENKRFWININRLGYRKKEPLDTETGVLLPTKIRSIILENNKRNLVTITSVLQKHHWMLDFVSYLFCVDKEWFYENRLMDTYSNTNSAEIISLFD